MQPKTPGCYILHQVVPQMPKHALEFSTSELLGTVGWYHCHYLRCIRYARDSAEASVSLMSTVVCGFQAGGSVSESIQLTNTSS